VKWELIARQPDGEDYEAAVLLTRALLCLSRAGKQARQGLVRHMLPREAVQAIEWYSVGSLCVSVCVEEHFVQQVSLRGAVEFSLGGMRTGSDDPISADLISHPILG
jgi:hypothetical protein